MIRPLLRSKLIWLLTALIILLLIGWGVLSSLAIWEPFSPGDALYPLQSWVEQVHLALIADPAELADRRLDILELRLQDLEYRAGSPFELYALGEFDQA